MKQFKPVIITAVICLVLAIGIFAAFKLIPEEPAQTLPPSNSDTKSAMIIHKSANSVKEVDIETDFGEKFTIEYTIDENGNQTGAIKKADKNFTYDESKIYTLAGHLGFMAAIEEIPEAIGNDADFGFKKPTRRIKVSYTDGTKIELLLGSKSPLDDGMYIKRVDTGKAYLIGGATQEMLMYTLDDYRIAELFTPIYNASSIKSMSVAQPGKKKFTVELKDDAEPISKNNPYAAQYQITKPVKADANNDAVENDLFGAVIDIEVEGFVDSDAKNLSKYGLDNPTKVEFETVEGKKEAFLIGAKAEEGGNYVMRDGTKAVMVTKEEVALDSIDYTNLLMKLLWLHNMDEVSYINYILPDGSRHTLSLDLKGDKLTANFDGGSITEDNATNLFMLSIRFALQGEIDDSMEYEFASVEMYMTLKDGSETSLKLARINERQYAAIVDDKPAEFYVNVNDVYELINAFKILETNGNIPSIF